MSINRQTAKITGVLGVTVLACMLISPLGLPRISEALGDPCFVYKKTIWLGAVILLASAMLTFILLRINNSSLVYTLSLLILQISFLAMYTYAVLFLDDCISCFAFLTKSCGIQDALWQVQR